MFLENTFIIFHIDEWLHISYKNYSTFFPVLSLICDSSQWIMSDLGNKGTMEGQSVALADIPLAINYCCTITSPDTIKTDYHF